MSGAGDLYETARQQTRDRLKAIREQHGAAAAGVVADGWIRGIRDELRQFAGEEDAYGMLQRHADGAAEPLFLSRANDILKG